MKFKAPTTTFGPVISKLVGGNATRSFHTSHVLLKKRKLPLRPPLLHQQTTTRAKLKDFDTDVVLHKLVKKNLLHMKINTMTEIQSKMFDFVDAGQDVVAASPLGSGKTLAYLVPWVNRRLMDYQQLKKGIHMVVLTPTSQTAELLYREIDQFIQLMGPNITMQAVYDTYSYQRQVQRLSKKIPRILVATPSRLRQHLEGSILTKTKNRKKPHLKRRTAFARWFDTLTSTIVLDEFDALMDIHKEDIDFILPYMAMPRQTIAVSSHEISIAGDQLPMKPDAKRIDCRLKVVSREEEIHKAALRRIYSGMAIGKREKNLGKKQALNSNSDLPISEIGTKNTDSVV